MRFHPLKISGGRGVLKNAPSPGPPFHKTFRIVLDCLDRRDSASLTGMFKKLALRCFSVVRFQKDHVSAKPKSDLADSDGKHSVERRNGLRSPLPDLSASRPYEDSVG